MSGEGSQPVAAVLLKMMDFRLGRALRAVLTAPDVPSAVRELETLAIDRLEGALVATLEDLFFVQKMLALGAGVLVAAVPTFILLALRH
ncbi:hypothetical protein OV207_28160 [Corallococcus sp. BB11-1]|uniref:hypothetical protein n=1 Tax=Corallococcus sp. BB11-1 TaxID=2996783 RepID=UPI00226E0026|nr:hypothetical protein [Corallococcus sp. BB11-1]MCY1035353.1 hypothetical protein [Corallococcus sp. BB11-1]